MKNSRRCDKCEFWEKHEHQGIENAHNDDLEGFCHRYPPVFNPGAQRNEMEINPEDEDGITCPRSSWCWMRPAIWAAHWCGEFKEKNDGK